MNTGTAHPVPVVHVVSWRLNGDRGEDKARQAGEILAALEATRSQVQGLLRLEAGPNVVDAAEAWDLAAVMVFESRAALDAYQAHPAHLALKALVGPMRSARGQIDFELPPRAPGPAEHP